MHTQNTRTQILGLIQEMREFPEYLPIGKLSLRRSDKLHEAEFNISNGTFDEFREFVNEFATSLAIDTSMICMDHSVIPVPYEDDYYNGIRIFVSLIETDTEYLERLKDMYVDWVRQVSNPITSSEWVKLYHGINSDLYVARNITMDGGRIERCLEALGWVYNSFNNDSNGEASLGDINRRQRAVYAKLSKEYC